MAQNTNNLPYFRTKKEGKEKRLANFLLRKFRIKIKEKFPHHYLIQPLYYTSLEFITKTSKKYPHFLRFDIWRYYPSINHQILLKKLPEIYQKIVGKLPSKRFKNYLENEIPEFLAKSPYGKGLPMGSPISYILGGIFLLDLDLEIKNPFLRQTDDYLIFCKNKQDPEFLLKNIILPRLTELGLEINGRKLKSGKFHRDKVNFIGFDFFAGYFAISEEKIEEFKNKITKITHLTKKKTTKAIIKQLNNKILGFGHYYKIASSQGDFRKLDAFVRQRLRRYISRNKDSKDRSGNLMLTNEALKSMGLKSLTDIYTKYAPKKRLILKKNKKKQNKNGLKSLSNLNLNYQKNIEKSLLLALFKELKEITKKLDQLNKKICKVNTKRKNQKTQ